MQFVDTAAIDRAIVSQAVPGSSLYEFVCLCWPQVESADFIDGRVVREVCLHLEAVSNGEVRRLIINMPPGFMKSYLVCVFWPMWEWAIRDVTQKWIFASYDIGLVYRDAERSLELMRTQWFNDRWGSLLWDEKRTAIGDIHTSTFKDNDGRSVKFDRWNCPPFGAKPVRAGWRFATSVKGKATGRHANKQVIDDPHKVLDVAAISQKELKKTHVWVDQTMSTRAEDPKDLARVLIMQRVHGNDLSSYCWDKGTYERLRLPMKYEPKYHSNTSVGGDWRTEVDELLWPEKADIEAVRILEEDLGSAYAVAAQLQQRPTPLGGLVFKEDWFGYWHTEGSKRLDPNGKRCVCLPIRGGRKYQSWDLRFKKNAGTSRVSGQVWWYHSSFFYLLARDCDTYSFTESCDAIRRMSIQWPDTGYKLIEAKANGDAAEDTLCDEIAGIELVDPKGGKPVRANACQSTIKTGHVILPHPSMPGFDWVKEFVKEVCGFPFASFDDDTDSMTQALNYVDTWTKRFQTAMNEARKQI